jgi:hypothetical protein
MSIKIVHLSLIVILFFVSDTCVFAHGTGVSYEEQKDGYKIDIGHDEFIAALESTRFDFTVYPENIDTAEGEIFTDVWVTFSKDKKLYFAGGVHKPVFGSTGFTYVFPEEGTYTVSARYQKEGETVVKTEFPIVVIAPLETKKEPNTFLMYGLLGSAGLLLGVSIGLFIPRKNNIITV